jgi:hypothetical protein
VYENLPGGDILEQGLRSMGKGLVDENSLLLLIGAYRLRQCGVDIRPLEIAAGFPEDELYQLLISKYGSDAYRMYNSLTRRLVSLENALENLTE